MPHLTTLFRTLATLSILIGGAPQPARAAEALATFAGGCFWSLEAAFDKLPGVLETTAGYTGGQDDAPTYERVTSGGTGHREAVRVRYDPEKLTYETLLVTFWHSINPVDRQGQFCDVGPSYTTAIFTHSAEQKRLAEESRTFLEQLKFRRPLATDILEATRFHPAEPEHQDFARQHPQTYARYRRQCGTDLGLAAIWGR